MFTSGSGKMTNLTAKDNIHIPMGQSIRANGWMISHMVWEKKHGLIKPHFEVYLIRELKKDMVNFTGLMEASKKDFSP